MITLERSIFSNAVSHSRLHSITHLYFRKKRKKKNKYAIYLYVKGPSNISRDLLAVNSIDFKFKFKKLKNQILNKVGIIIKKK